MDFLKAEINKQKQQMKAVTKGAEVKYMRRADIERELERKRLEEEEQRKAKKRKLNDSQAAPSPVVSSPPPPPQPAVDALGDWAKLPKSEVFSRLRSMMLPVTLFGETDEMRCRRLREAELQHEERQTNIHAFNVNQQIEQEIEQEIAQAAAAGTHVSEVDGEQPSEMKSAASPASPSSPGKHHPSDSDSDFESDSDASPPRDRHGSVSSPPHDSSSSSASSSSAAAASSSSSSAPAAAVSASASLTTQSIQEAARLAEEKQEMLRKKEERRKEKEKQHRDSKWKSGKDFAAQEDFVYYFLKRILREWEEELNARPDAEKRTIKGKEASSTQKQTRQYIRPFFRMLKAKTVPADILEPVHHIISLMEQLEYVRANDLYLELSIGNAAWPMGVTAVGIHERTGREKIAVKQIAHILNDETTRKYIQSLKRLMTYRQKKYPNPDPSKNFS